MKRGEGTGADDVARLSLSSGEARSEILIGAGLLARSCELLESYRGSRLLIVSDERVSPLYAGPLRAALGSCGYDAHVLGVPAGEEAKSLEVLGRLYEQCQRLRVERRDVVLAVGGGATGDLAGMLAGTYMRGLDFVQVPTSLVAMVTASVGGKVGVNFGGSKNLIGLFKQPSLVLADTGTLSTLPEAEYRSGLGELVTVGVLGAPRLFEAVESSGVSSLAELIVAAVECKIAIVEADPYDRKGIRERLNLGHTFGHALEVLSDFTLPHGLAVAVGLRIASRLSVALGLCTEVLAERIRRVLAGLGLPTALEGYSPERVIDAMRGDKKRVGGRLRWVLPVELGRVTAVGEDDVPRALLEGVLRETVWEGVA